MLASGLSPRLATEDVVIYPATEGAPDRYGNPTPGEGPPVTVRGAVQPIGALDSTTEDERSGDTRTSRYRVYAPADAPVDGLARVEWRGRSFDVVGEPEVHAVGGRVRHLRFDMREILG